MDDSIIEILHHNRDRDKLIEMNFISNNFELFDIFISEDIISKYMAKYYFIEKLLTSSNETKMLIKNIKKYIDEEKSKDENYLYTVQLSKEVLQFYLSDDKNFAYHNKDLKAFLNNRGVTDKQINEFKILDLEKIKAEHKTVLGANIHPALHWIKETEPTGCLFPVHNMQGEYTGNHNRYINTVPKMKFCSSIPNLFLFSNLYKESKPKEIYIVEGVFDALAINIADPKAFWLSPSSGYFTTEQMTILTSLLVHFFPHSKINCCLDSDRIGSKNNLVLAGIFTHRANIKEYPEGSKDMAEFILKNKGKLEDLEDITFREKHKSYKNMEHKPIIEYDLYIKNKLINNDYNWKGGENEKAKI